MDVGLTTLLSYAHGTTAKPIVGWEQLEELQAMDIIDSPLE